MKKFVFLFALMLLVPGSSLCAEEIATGPERESPYVDADPNDPFDSTDDDPGFAFAETESDQASPSITLTSATVTFDPKKKDKFVLKGTTGSLSLAGATSVIFEAGPFKQEITIGMFTKSKEKYTFKGAAGATGLASLILDMPKGQFSATVQNVFLTGFTNPSPVSLKAGTTAECSMAQFSVNKNKWTFSASSNSQYACLITQVPQATPRGLFVNQAKDIRVQALVPSNPGLDQNSVELFHVDEKFNILGGPLCALLDNGNLSNGDQTAGDRTFSCLANLQEGTAGKMVLMVGAELKGKMTYSPSFTLDVVTPYTEQEAQQTLTAQENAGQKWQENLAKYGDTKKARTETAKAAKKLEGVKDAGVSSDGVNIWIEFTSGIRGGMILSQEEDQTSGTAGPFAGKKERAAWKMPAGPLSVQPTSCKQKSGAAEETSSAELVGNCNVLVWDLFAHEWTEVKTDPFEEHPLEFQVWRQMADEKGEYCTVDSLRETTNYGTVLITTERHKSRVLSIYKTNEHVTWQKLGEEKYMFDLLTGCLEAWINPVGEWNFYFTPSFISTLEGKFNKSIVYVVADDSSELASAFLKKGAHTFFGYSGSCNYTNLHSNPWVDDTRLELFNAMVKDGKDTGEAYAALSKRSEGGSYFLKYSSSTKEIAYQGQGCYLLQWVDADFPPSASPPPNRVIEYRWNGNEIRYKVDVQKDGLSDVWVSIISYSNDQSDKEWNIQAKELRELAADQGSDLLRNDTDYIVPGYKSTHKDGGYAPGTWALKFHRGTIIKVMSNRCYVLDALGNKYDSNCADSRIPGWSQNQLLSRYDNEVQIGMGVVNAKCKQNGCVD